MRDIHDDSLQYAGQYFGAAFRGCIIVLVQFVTGRWGVYRNYANTTDSFALSRKECIDRAAYGIRIETAAQFNHDISGHVGYWQAWQDVVSLTAKALDEIGSKP